MSPVSHGTPRGQARIGWVGVTVASTDCRIVVDGRDAGPGEAGELWVRGPQGMLGYHNRPEATAETLTEDGWPKTGDLAEVDEDGAIRAQLAPDTLPKRIPFIETVPKSASGKILRRMLPVWRLVEALRALLAQFTDERPKGSRRRSGKNLRRGSPVPRRRVRPTSRGDRGASASNGSATS